MNTWQRPVRIGIVKGSVRVEVEPTVGTELSDPVALSLSIELECRGLEVPKSAAWILGVSCVRSGTNFINNN